MDDSERPSTFVERPNDILDGTDGIAVPLWQSYNAMESTKRRHFECLEIIDEKKKNFNIDPTEADRQRLAALLKDHDEQVKRFTQASHELKTVDAAAFAALFAYIGSISGASGSSPMTH